MFIEDYTGANNFSLLKLTGKTVRLKTLYCKDYIVSFTLRLSCSNYKEDSDIGVLIEKRSNTNYWEFATKGTKLKPGLSYEHKYPKYLTAKIEKIYNDLQLYIYGFNF